MSGLYFLFALIGVILIIAWYIRNDGVSAGERTMGLLRMRDEAGPQSSD